MLYDKLMKFFQDMPGTLLAFVTFLITASGMLIINLHLGTYFVTDYNIINTRAIHSGIVFFLAVGLSIATTFAFLEMRDVAKIGLHSSIKNFFTKPIHLTNIFMMWFVYIGNTPDEASQLILFDNIKINTYWLYPLLMSSFFGLLAKINGFEFIKKDGDLLGKGAGKISDFFLNIGLIPFPFLVYFSDTYNGIFWFFATISFWCFGIFGVIQDKARRDAQGVSPVDTSLFTYQTIMKPMGILDSVFFTCVVILMFISLSATYSKSLYPALKLQYGGGKAIEMVVTMEDGGTYNGRLFHYDDKRYYLMVGTEAKTVFIDAAKIKSIEKAQLGVPLPK